MTTMSKDMDEQFKLVEKVIDVADQVKRTICLTLLRYNVEKPDFICSSPMYSGKEGARDVSSNCLCDL